MAEKRLNAQDNAGQTLLRDEKPQGHQDQSSDSRHMPFTFDVRMIAVTALILGGIALIFHVGNWFLMQAYAADPHHKATGQSPLALIPRTPPPPGLQIDPTMDDTAYRRREESLLNGYGWVDRRGGIVHIPIAASMERVVREGVAPEPGDRSGSAVDPVRQGGQSNESDAPSTPTSPRRLRGNPRQTTPGALEPSREASRQPVNELSQAEGKMQ